MTDGGERSKRDILAAHPRLRKPGFGVPDVQGLISVPLNAEARSLLGEHGIMLEGSPGPENWIYLPTQRQPLRLRIVMGRAVQDNRIIVEDGCNWRHNCTITLDGSNAGVILRRAQGTSHVNLTVRGDRGLFYYGANCTSNYTDCLVHGSASMLIGEDSMFAANTVIRTYDSHAIIDVASAQQINHPQDVLIGRHVWLGRDATVMPGASIGDGAIVAAGSIVTHPVATRTLVVGVPARTLRAGVTWAREAHPSRTQIDAALRISDIDPGDA